MNTTKSRLPLEVIRKLKLEGAPAEEIRKILKQNKLTPEMLTYIFSKDT